MTREKMTKKEYKEFCEKFKSENAKLFKTYDIKHYDEKRKTEDWTCITEKDEESAIEKFKLYYPTFKVLSIKEYIETEEVRKKNEDLLKGGD